MIPSSRLYICLIPLLVLGFMAPWLPVQMLWWLALGVIVIMSVADAITLFLPKVKFEHERDISGSLPVGVWKTVHLTLTNKAKNSETIEVFDDVPEHCEFKNLPQTVTIKPDQKAKISYQIKFLQRGPTTFQTTYIHRQSKLKLWKRKSYLGDASESKIYPNFSAITQYILLALDNRLSQLGVIKKRRRGQGQDFLQLRDYRYGDPLRQVDWKATAKNNKLISKEYQDERDQQIIFALDCGHRMLTKDEQLSHFDHALNAILLLSYVALRQGDSVGLLAFGAEERWIKPVKGQHHIQTILNGIYDLYPTSVAPDYVNASLSLLKRQKKRALVVFVSNLRDEDSKELITAANTLNKHHLVLLSSMKEAVLEESLEKDVLELDDAIKAAATHHYVAHRDDAFKSLKQHRVLAIDVEPQNLSVSLVNKYLEIKSGTML